MTTRRWDCRKKFVVKSGRLSMEAEVELLQAEPGRVKRTRTKGHYSFSCQCEAPTAGDAAMLSNRMLVELLGPYGVVVQVTHSDNTLIGAAS